MTEKYPDNWDEIRREIYNRDNYECQACGAQGGQGGNTELHAHHKIPVSEGGSHEASNLVTLCQSCHNSQHNHDITGDSSQKVSLQNRGVLANYVFIPLLVPLVYTLVVLMTGFLIWGIFHIVPFPVLSTTIPGLAGIAGGLLVAVPLCTYIGFEYPVESVIGYSYPIALYVSIIVFYIVAGGDAELSVSTGIGSGIIEQSLYVMTVFAALCVFILPFIAGIGNYYTEGRLKQKYNGYMTIW